MRQLPVAVLMLGLVTPALAQPSDQAPKHPPSGQAPAGEPSAPVQPSEPEAEPPAARESEAPPGAASEPVTAADSAAQEAGTSEADASAGVGDGDEPAAGAAQATGETDADEAADEAASEADHGEDDAEDEEEEEDEADEEDEGEAYSHHGIELPGQLQLHGMFDVAYERHGYTDDLSEGKDALRNYHHFLFLRREAAGDPLGLEVELVDLTFYEIGLRLTDRGSPWRVDLKLGKVLVPFGDEPLFHHMYGGQGGFNQRFVPAVWARHGGIVRVQHRLGDLSIQNDAYLVQGHAIDASDAVIDLQADGSSADDVQLAVGERVGLAWDAITVWYSLYYSRLGYDRQLLLQAIDVGLHRLRDVPVLEDIAISIGVARADVSGGTWTEERVPLEHYYHFADYLQLRYYVLEWLQIEGRTGVLFTNNREGVYRDDDRDDVTDVDTHTLGVSMRYRGLFAGLHHVWRLEARDERADDYLRLRIGYAF